MGGAVAMELALRTPNRVRKVVLVDALGFGTEVAPGILDKLVNSNTREEVQALMAVAVHDPALVLPVAVERSYAYRQEPGVQALLKRVAAQFSDGTRNLVDYSRRLKDLKMPVLVVWGKEDRMLPVSNASHAKALPSGRLKVFDRCGHLPQLEKAAEFNALVMEFLMARDTPTQRVPSPL
ncbi:MAG TPA: alpha/beta fold hydrolase, partial [bacterium]|nr:alpha/beta fold hydrolase [bacterium]